MFGKDIFKIMITKLLRMDTFASRLIWIIRNNVPIDYDWDEELKAPCQFDIMTSISNVSFMQQFLLDSKHFISGRNRWEKVSLDYASSNILTWILDLMPIIVTTSEGVLRLIWEYVHPCWFVLDLKLKRMREDSWTIPHQISWPEYCSRCWWRLFHEGNRNKIPHWRMGGPTLESPWSHILHCATISKQASDMAPGHAIQSDRNHNLSSLNSIWEAYSIILSPPELNTCHCFDDATTGTRR